MSEEEILNLFPGHVKVFALGELQKSVAPVAPMLLDKHFDEPPSKEMMEQLVWEISHFLKEKDPYALYSFFYRKDGKDSQEWLVASARLHKDEQGLPNEVVMFSYTTGLSDDVKIKLHRVLEQYDFLRQNVEKVALLTNREKEILGLVAEGMTSDEIAKAIHLSRHTVNTHRKNIYRKLSIQNSADLLKFAEVLGFISSTDHNE
ncbi:helix-turn-helix transcriptional regulator [Pseudoflavitalea sp. X16]|uniref:response regulator transcription factor n=1 Tax=Paraflavitalea devenefica TaxID=2716334 RepID=UPI0014214A13|nr:helix-turn-helix transcriptional regulator [Paraflavitalea devenefica]NII27734.1 helix-turn-helix transcriptional regulator [Paraflavitalea devenefica]